jgi:hypothetical protein
LESAINDEQNEELQILTYNFSDSLVSALKKFKIFPPRVEIKVGHFNNLKTD